MATPQPTQVSPWYLRNINQALALNESNGTVYVRTSGGLSGLIDIAAGDVLGTSGVFVHGYNSSFANGAEESFWGNSSLYPWSAWDSYTGTGTTLDIVSSSAGDTQTVLLDGLDENFEPLQESVTLTGTIPVTTTGTFMRMNTMYITSGSSTNAGTITAVPTGTATVIEQISPNLGTAQNSQYTIPAGYTGYVMQGSAQIGKGQDGTMYFKVRPFGSVFTAQFVVLLYQDTFQYKFTVPFMVPEKTDLDVTMVASSSGTSGTCSYDLILVQNTIS
jgi:hypothetical protein